LYCGIKATALAAIVAAAFAADACAAPHIRITSPKPEQVLRGPDVRVQFSVSGAHLQPGGTNVHFMLDNEPFEVQFDASHPHVFKDVAPGTHTIRAYIANTMHEAIRGTLSSVTFSVAYPSEDNRQCGSAPTLTYNLPQGEYLGIDAADIAVDFLVSNVRLTPGGNKVAYYADGRRFFSDGTSPGHLKGLRPGYHVVRIELQDENGDLIEGPFNSVERTILVSPESSVNSDGVLASKYGRSIPRVTSIRGAMTMGRPWTAVEKPRPMTAAQVRESQRLTVRHAGAAEAAGATGIVEGTTEAGTVTSSKGESSAVSTEAPEVTTEHTETHVTRTESNVPAEAPATTEHSTSAETQTSAQTRNTAERANGPTRDALSSSTRVTSSGRRLDDRLERSATAPETSTLRAEAPTSSGRSIVRRVPVNNAGTSGTRSSRSSSTTTTAATDHAGAATPLAQGAAPTPGVSPAPVSSTPAAAATPAPTPAFTPAKAGEETPLTPYAPGQTSPTPVAAETNTTSGTAGAP
jgi:hypothetical protein